MFKIRQRAAHHYGRIKEFPGKASQQVEESFEFAKLFAYKTIIAVLTLSILVFLAIFMYGMFYFTFVPKPEHEGEIFLQFEPCEKTPGRCGFLNGSLQLSRRNQVLMAGQPYTVAVLLQMPESPTNRNRNGRHSGMFMACAQLKTRDSTLIRTNCKSSILQYRSELLRIIDTFVFLPGLLTGHTAEKQVVQIQFFDDFFDDPLSPAIQLDVQVKSRFVEIYSATYRIHANFSGLRYMMFHYPLTSAVVGSSLNMILLSVLFLLSWYRFFINKDEEVLSEKSGLFTDPFLTEEEEEEKEEKEREKKEAETSGETETKTEDREKIKERLSDFLEGEEEKAFVMLQENEDTLKKEE